MDGVASTQPHPLKSFIRRFRTEILAEWRRGARELPIARNLSSVALVDHIPELLDEVADIAAELVSTSHGVRRTFETANEHALDRLAEGFDVATVVHELSLLRAAVLTVWSREGEQDLSGLHAIDLAIDRAIAASVRRYIEVHERTLAGIDRISTASFESSNVDDFMHRLLRVFVETTPAVNTAAILLLEGDVLRVRASVGIEGVENVVVPVGEGFSGTIAATREPLALRSAYLDPRVNSVVRDQMIRALYGVPLIHEGKVIGVAHMGSLTAHELSHEDRQFFGSMAARATLGIVHHVLRQELADSEARFKQLAGERELALAELESLLAASPIGIAFVDPELRYVRINDALATLNGRPASEHVGRTIREALPAEVADKLEPMLRHILATGQPLLGLELSAYTGAGELKHMLVNYFPVRSTAGEIYGIGAVIVDVTPLAQAREALQVEQQRIQSILEHAPASIWVKDPNGRVMLANHRLAAALGAEFQNLVGRRSAELLPPEYAAAHEAHDAMVLSEQRSIEVEETVPSPEGNRTFLTVKFPIPGNPPLVGGIATEITQRKRMEE
jgi:PAS domain S-box-containing protein